MKIPSLCRFVVVLGLAGCGLSAVKAADVFVRFKVIEPSGAKFRVTAGGYIHVANWRLPDERVDVAGGQWSRWLDLRGWTLHGRLDRVGGIAEWPAMSLTVNRLGEGAAIDGCSFEVQLADKPEPESAVISFREKSASQTIVFLVPHPLREKKAEFETGSQMTARHLAWAQAASGGRAPALKKFDVITSVWGHYDPELARQATQTLRLLGFNVMGGVPVEALQGARMRTYAATWHLVADPEESAAVWNKGEAAQIARRIESAEGRWTYENMAHYVIADEIQTMDFRAVDRVKLDGWFRDYLRGEGETDQSLGRPIDGVQYPAEAMYAKSLPRDADLPTRKVMYYAGKFGQWWSVKQLRQTTDLVRSTFARHGVRMKTETLPSDHSFFNAWGPPSCGMGYRGLDLFEIGAQEAVDVVSAEDWMGLNRMYGPGATWTGAMAFGYLSAILRSGIGDRDVALRALITPSDDGYLRLKAYSALGQGTKSFFFWTFGPTYIGTENYWSDLESEYGGIAKLTRALEKAEPILYDAKPVRDPVAILYSVSHDQWHTDQPAGFVENRLTWVALRHMGVQPDFLREEDVEAGRLAGYKVLYVTGECLTRKASRRIDDWVRAGGVVHLCAAAATRDEFFEPYLPAFAAAVWPADASAQTIKQTGHAFNERVDLPTIEPITTVTIPDGQNESKLKVLGVRLDVLPTSQPAAGATFADGKPAARVAAHGKGKVVAVGFMPGLAYSPFKPGQTTLDEQWPLAPRRVLGIPLAEAGLIGTKDANRGTLAAAYEIVEPAGAAGPIESSLLTGPQGSAIVLVNHGYKPIRRLRMMVRLPQAVRTAVSTEGAPVEIKQPGNDGKGVMLELPLDWTDIVLLPKA
ncbi:MAG: hypothetical protein ACYC35_11360 [Pirellulales bacterium]